MKQLYEPWVDVSFDAMKPLYYYSFPQFFTFLSIYFLVFPFWETKIYGDEWVEMIHLF